jgi:hypothetical protein
MHRPAYSLIFQAAQLYYAAIAEQPRHTPEGGLHAKYERLTLRWLGSWAQAYHPVRQPAAGSNEMEDKLEWETLQPRDLGKRSKRWRRVLSAFLRMMSIEPLGRDGKLQL